MNNINETNNLREFRAGLECYMTDPYARPFVCTGSPLKCRSFIVGINSATRLTCNFWSYWSDITGFDREKFKIDYLEHRKLNGNRPRIEAMAKEIGSCLETNLYAIPTKKAKELTEKDRISPVVEYLFKAIKPKVVFVHSNEPICFFEKKTGCVDFTSEAKQAHWQGHDFWLLGRPGPLYRLSIKNAMALGTKLAAY